MDKHINTVGVAIVFQSIIRYGAFGAMLWLVLTFANEWVFALIDKL